MSVAPAGVPSTEPDFIAQLLREQSELSAVEEFASWHTGLEFLASTYSALMPAQVLQSGEQYAFEVDLDACSGCKACVVACHSLNGLNDAETWRKVGSLTSQSTIGLPIVQHVTTACHHCVEPGCLQGCPVRAYEKDPITGIVKHLDDQCFGCTYCIMMCPYEVPQYSPSLGIVRKCDMCTQRISADHAPACVQACPNQAIRIAIVNKASISTIAESSPESSLVATAPCSSFTKPTTQYRSRLGKDLMRELASQESTHDEVHEGHLPLVTMLTLTQLSVGMWLMTTLLGNLATELPSTNSLVSFVIAAAAGVAGTLAALLHLGRPWLAFRSILGWRTSWLSREALAFGAYLKCALATCALLALPLIIGELSNDPIVVNIVISSAMPLQVTTAILGILGVGCSAMIYVATRRELWNGMRSGWDFGTTTLGLGILGTKVCTPTLNDHWLSIGAALAATSCLPMLQDVLRYISIRNPSSRCLASRSGSLLLNPLAGQWICMWTLNAVALIFAVSALAGKGPSSGSIFLSLFVLSLSLSAQAIHRWLYFASVVYRRMPGAST